MIRREFITLLGGTAAAWPLAARAQSVRRVGVLMNLAPDDAQGQARVEAFRQALRLLGWIDGNNLRIDYRWGEGDVDRIRMYAVELVALKPDVIFIFGGATTGPVQQITRTVPLVFAGIIDPVSSGLVASLARPGGNVTGFTLLEYGMSTKWLELLKEIAPVVTRVAVMRDASQASGIGQLGSIQAVAPSFGVELKPISLNDPGDIERAVSAFAREPNGGLIVVANTLAVVHRELIVTLAAKHRLAAVYSGRDFVASGGLISYGPDRLDLSRRAASYVDRILKGEKPADLPVQAPTKFELIINLKTSKALGIQIPPTLLARADEVIE